MRRREPKHHQRCARQLSEATVSIETIIADRLRSLGYTVHTDIGCSGYKIDIGIVDTENTSNYQLGIICDGKNYKRTKTARDREIVQNNVLKALGWDIYRIWTMDWWEKPDEVMATIQEAIARKKNSKVGSMTAAEINSTPTEVAAPAPTAQITNNEISFVLKASPVAPEKQAASVLSTQNRIEQKYKFAKITHTVIHRKTFSLRTVTLSSSPKYGRLWKARRQSVNPCSVRKSCPNGESAAWEHG